MLRSLLFTVTVSCAPAAQAQFAPVTTADLCEHIITAQRQVLVYTPNLTNLPFADCLRKAALEYKRRVFLLTVPYFAQDSSSAVRSLALAGMSVYQGQVNAKDSVVVVDGITYFATNLGVNQNALITPQNEEVTASYLKWFQSALGRSKRLTRTQAFQSLQR